ncbi:MAG TPA: class I SAM-dependent methyltransferase [Xanthobacteraceae bacterium]|jgi:predicted O-methyltransferase YrrM
MSLTFDSVKTILNSADIGKEWAACAPRLSELCRVEDGKTGGVNPGDRRALFYLVRAFRPAKVLEIGTHVGMSTLHICAALACHTRSQPPCLITVDIEDVNDGALASWKKAGLAKSPKQLLEEFTDKVEIAFVVNDSRHFFADNKERFDFIFLDGDHAAETVYDEIISSLDVINEKGLLVLHDYFPDGRPLWSDGSLVCGPFTAVEEVRASGIAIKVVPLGALPWPTKLGSHVTSLALIAR